ncbi:MAG: metallophosphoesterase [Micrococcaceae bacterium]
MDLRTILALIAAIVLIVFFFWIPWTVIVNNIVENPKLRRTLRWIFIAAIALSIPAMYLGHAKHFDPARLYADLFMGTSWIAFTWSFIVGIIGFILAKLTRLDLKKPTGFTALATVLAMLAIAVYGGMKQPAINHDTIKIAKLNSKMNGLKVAVISDTHFGPINRVQWMKTLVDRINEEQPDVVLFAGDIADGTPSQRKEEAAQLKNIKAKYRGYVTGNHEYIEGAVAWEDTMSSLGWTVLHNKNMQIQYQGGTMTIAGIDDRSAAQYHIAGQGANIKAALQGVDHSQAILLVAHQPKQVSDAIAQKVDLQVSGHTHGGQIWPFQYFVPLDQPLLEGLKNFNGTQLFVTRGAGTWGPPMRLFAPSEINMLTLVNGS